MKNVLYISYDGLTDNLGQSQILPYIIRISENNFKFHLITCDKQEKLDQRKSHLLKLIGTKNIQWSYNIYHKSPPIISTWYDLKRMYKKAEEIIRTSDIQLIHCRSYPAMSIGLKLKRKYGIPVIFDMRGFYPEERVEGGIWDLRNPIHKYVYNKIKKRERTYLQESDAIVSLTHSGKNDLLNRNLGLNESQIWVVPCAADYDHFRVIEDVEKKNELVYLGSIGTWYLLKEMLEFFSSFLSVHPDWKLRFITTDDKSLILKCANELDIPIESLRIGPCERENLPRALNQARASIFFIKPSYSKTASYPTKLAESLACGLPVICNENVGDLNIFAENYPFVRAIKLNQGGYSETASNFITWNSFSPMEIREKTKLECGLVGASETYMNIYNNIIGS